MLGERLLRHDDGLPDPHVLVLELGLSSGGTRALLAGPHHRGPDRKGSQRRDDDQRQRLHGKSQSMGLRLATISVRCGSRNGGSTIFSPRVSASSSTPNPGPSVAISNSTPFGSRKYRLRNQ